jgi:hypothetical protein
MPVVQTSRLIYYMWSEPTSLRCYHIPSAVNSRSISPVDGGIDRRSAARKHSLENLPNPTSRNHAMGLPLCKLSRT